MTAEEREALALDAQAAALDRVMHYLALHVERLCKVRFAANYLLANKAHRFYAELPPDDGDDFADYLLSEVKVYADQFPKVGNIEKRAEVTEAVREVMEDTQ